MLQFNGFNPIQAATAPKFNARTAPLRLASPAADVVQLRFAGLGETELKELAKHTVVDRRGNSPGIGVFFRLRTEVELSAGDASKIQMYKGYHPMGYGFYQFHAGKAEDGSNVYTWACAGSCD